MVFSDTDTSTHNIDFFQSVEGFITHGILGYGFWFPAATLSGKLDNCDIIVDGYENVKREGPLSNGGSKRYYYESMNGFGEYFPESDSIAIFINYTRTELLTLDFSGYIYFKKVE